MIETGAENLSDALDAYLNSQLTEIEMEDLSEKMVLDLTCDFVEMADGKSEATDTEVIYALLQAACVVAKRNEEKGETGWIDLVDEAIGECLLMIDSCEIAHPDLIKAAH